MEHLSYPDMMVRCFRYQFCPMCKAQLLRRTVGDDPTLQVTCSSCGWIANITNLSAAVSVVTTDGGIVTILPPGLAPETPAALPAGLIEYGESPEEAAVREIHEETGFEAEIVRSLGWYYFREFDSIHQLGAAPEWPGPLLYFMFEARTVAGRPKGSSEGMVRVFPLEAFPGIVCPARPGSLRAIQAHLAYSE